MESFLFDVIFPEKRYALPNSRYWEMWHSDKQDALRRLGFIPRPYGELVGEPAGTWIVSLPQRNRNNYGTENF